MEKIVSTLAALGVPGLVLLIAMSATGFAGAAAITAALAALGPGGIIGGIALLGVIGLVSKGITEFGFDAIFVAVVKELVKRGESKDSILAKINSYPVMPGLKRKLREELQNLCLD